jgi:hypothetical protein
VHIFPPPLYRLHRRRDATGLSGHVYPLPARKLRDRHWPAPRRPPGPRCESTAAPLARAAPVLSPRAAATASGSPPSGPAHRGRDAALANRKGVLFPKPLRPKFKVRTSLRTDRRLPVWATYQMSVTHLSTSVGWQNNAKHRTVRYGR